MGNAVPSKPAGGLQVKFIIGGLLIVAAIVFLISTSLSPENLQYFKTISELKNEGQANIGRELRVTGAVVGATVNYNGEKDELTFTVADISADNAEIEKEGGLAAALHNAVTDPNRARLQVVYKGPKPDLMQDEAQAIMTGKLDENGIFRASELLMKCPSKYEEELPTQAVTNP